MVCCFVGLVLCFCFLIFFVFFCFGLISFFLDLLFWIDVGFLLLLLFLDFIFWSIVCLVRGEKVEFEVGECVWKGFVGNLFFFKSVVFIWFFFIFFFNFCYFLYSLGGCINIDVNRKWFRMVVMIRRYFFSRYLFISFLSSGVDNMVLILGDICRY